MRELRKFYYNKTVLITGHTGFKGSWLAYALNKFGAKVIGYSLPSDQKNSSFNILKLNKKIINVYSDIRNKTVLKNTMEKYRPDIIFHLAAQPLVRKSYDDPLFTIETNVNGTLNIINNSKDLKNLKSLVIITSDKCYKNKENINGYNESDELGGDDPYSSSKASAEIISHAYIKSYFNNKKKLGVATARAGNVIGGGDWSENRVIPDFVKSILKQKKFFLRSPQSTRPWQHVFDIIFGYLLLAKKIYRTNKFNGSYNFGPNKKEIMNVIQIINYIKKKIKSKKKINIKKIKSLKETKTLVLKSFKSKKILKWRCNFSLKKTLDVTSEWYNCVILNENVQKLSEKQFNKYFFYD